MVVMSWIITPEDKIGSINICSINNNKFL